MAFGDTTPRKLLFAWGQSRVTLAAAVVVGDMIGMNGANQWVLAKAAAPAILARYVAAEAGAVADEISVFRTVVLEAAYGAVAGEIGDVVYLSDTAGGTSLIAGATTQVLGWVDSATTILVQARNPLALDATDIANDSIDSQHYAPGSVDSTAIATGAVDSAEIAAGAVDLTHMSADSVDSTVLLAGSVDWTHLADNSVNSNNYIDGSLDAVHLDPTLITGFIPLDITALRKIATNAIPALAAIGGLLAADTTPFLERANAAVDKSLRVTWTTPAAFDSVEVQFPPVPMPVDLNAAVTLSIHLLAAMGAGNNTATIDVQVWDAVGDAEMGGATAAITGTTVAEYSRDIAAANIAGPPLGFLNIQLTPGAHTTDQLFVYAAWIEYRRG